MALNKVYSSACYSSTYAWQAAVGSDPLPWFQVRLEGCATRARRGATRVRWGFDVQTASRSLLVSQVDLQYVSSVSAVQLFIRSDYPGGQQATPFIVVVTNTSLTPGASTKLQANASTPCFTFSGGIASSSIVLPCVGAPPRSPARGGACEGWSLRGVEPARGGACEGWTRPPC